MARKRRYDSGCAVAHALDLVGERWALLVVRELLLGPKRFTDLLAGLPGAGPDMLTQRLRELTEAQVVRRRRLGPPSASWVYELTPWGGELAPTVLGLARWAARSPGMAYDAPLSVDSVMLSLAALFDRRTAAELNATIVIRVDDQAFRLRIADGELGLTRGDDEQPDAALETDQDSLLALLRTDRDLDPMLADGSLRLTGDRALIERFRQLFPLPQPAGAERGA
ncbi:winged helix-turn-helix transcriptional regulator [[Mycobacterium] nativiensis]|uniref:Winged helix-turn-helix transcriptional regulator n=1 Tax=[Mycobacterium] nativiensis TaxID=2855503 RepID=A0ABU5Y418_9MYCO|nr:winged helix-turn-helix transcriptional regulator [Mycolicibacter sp. MYC340]MEB3034951.1 winged helix-turn-helix transcriptional regulator [Mycolicibacter sp. MYC340]